MNYTKFSKLSDFSIIYKNRHPINYLKLSYLKSREKHNYCTQLVCAVQKHRHTLETCGSISNHCSKVNITVKQVTHKNTSLQKVLTALWACSRSSPVGWWEDLKLQFVKKHSICEVKWSEVRLQRNRHFPL